MCVCVGMPSAAGVAVAGVLYVGACLYAVEQSVCVYLFVCLYVCVGMPSAAGVAACACVCMCVFVCVLACSPLRTWLQ
jgi:hypothetical protein